MVAGDAAVGFAGGDAVFIVFVVGKADIGEELAGDAQVVEIDGEQGEGNEGKGKMDGALPAHARTVFAEKFADGFAVGVRGLESDAGGFVHFVLWSYKKAAPKGALRRRRKVISYLAAGVYGTVKVVLGCEVGIVQRFTSKAVRTASFSPRTVASSEASIPSPCP